MRWTPLSPIDEQKGLCLDLASSMYDVIVSQSLTKDAEIGLSCQIALRPNYIAQKIDTHVQSTSPKSFKGEAVPVRAVQCNVQTLKDERDEIDLHIRFKLGKCGIICLQEIRENIMASRICMVTLDVLPLVYKATTEWKWLFPSTATLLLTMKAQSVL